MATAASRPMMATTIIISTSVRPERFRVLGSMIKSPGECRSPFRTGIPPALRRLERTLAWECPGRIRGAAGIPPRSEIEVELATRPGAGRVGPQLAVDVAVDPALGAARSGRDHGHDRARGIAGDLVGGERRAQVRAVLGAGRAVRGGGGGELRHELRPACLPGVDLVVLHAVEADGLPHRVEVGAQ